jgi:tetratricopeptide (TPR) repeat protein
VTRAFLAAFFLSYSLAAQQPPPDSKKKPPPTKQEDDPPEEDVSLRPREYPFQSAAGQQEHHRRELLLQEGQLRRGARSLRGRRQVQPGSAEAYLKLGEAFEKLRDKKQARVAYEKYIELAQDAKSTDAIKKENREVAEVAATDAAKQVAARSARSRYLR